MLIVAMVDFLPPLILLAAGGTGGHMFPARALAETLLARGCRVVFACDSRGRRYLDGMEDRIEIHLISSGAYRPGLLGKARLIYPLLKGLVQSFLLVRRLRPQVTVGFGGYPSVPPVMMAQLLRLPTVLHEQNAVLGLANRLLSRYARKIALSWRDTRRLNVSAGRTVVTGNPVRAEISALRDQAYRFDSKKINLLIIGGSQGAAVFSEILPEALASLPEGIRSRLEITQQVVPEQIERVRSYYKQKKVPAVIASFFDDIPERLKQAHLLITRSGASTIAELTAAGRPALYVPYPWHSDQQQLFNAEAVASIGGGWVMEEGSLTASALAEKLTEIVVDPEILTHAAAQAATLGQPDAAGKLADLVIQSAAAP